MMQDKFEKTRTVVVIDSEGESEFQERAETEPGKTKEEGEEKEEEEEEGEIKDSICIEDESQEDTIILGLEEGEWETEEEAEEPWQYPVSVWTVFARDLPRSSTFLSNLKNFLSDAFVQEDGSIFQEVTLTEKDLRSYMQKLFRHRYTELSDAECFRLYDKIMDSDFVAQRLLLQ